jgi:hypothetical protein
MKKILFAGWALVMFAGSVGVTPCYAFDCTEMKTTIQKYFMAVRSEAVEINKVNSDMSNGIRPSRQAATEALTHFHNAILLLNNMLTGYNVLALNNCISNDDLQKGINFVQPLLKDMEISRDTLDKFHE